MADCAANLGLFVTLDCVHQEICVCLRIPKLPNHIASRRQRTGGLIAGDSFARLVRISLVE